MFYIDETAEKEYEQDLQRGKSLQGSDGSYCPRRKRGTHGYRLETATGRLYIEGYAATPASNEMSSLPTEHFGVLAVLTSLLAITTKNSQLKSNNVTIHLDNKEVVDRGNEKRNRRNIKHYLIKDYDLKATTREMVATLPIKEVHFKWQKGHMEIDQADETSANVIQLNIRCDELATMAYSLPINDHRPFFKAGKIAMYYNNLHIQNLRKHVIQQTQETIMEEYLIECRKWKPQWIQQVDWDAIETYLSHLTDTRRCTIIKLMHGWQNTNSQKMKFYDAKNTKKVDWTEEEITRRNNIGKCPTGCGKCEEQLHYIKCDNEKMLQKQMEEQIRLRKAMEKLQTPPEVKTIIMLGIKQGAKGEEMPYDEIPKITNSEWGTHLFTAIQQQDDIGWNKMLCGFISRQWRECMDNYYKATGQHTVTKNGERWAVKMLTILHDYCMNLWEVRNSFLHGGKTKAKRSQRHEYLVRQVKQQYQRYRGHLPWKYRSLFNLPIEQRCKQGPTQLEIWILRTTIILNKYDEEKGLQTNLDNWIIPTNQRDLYQNPHNTFIEEWDRVLQGQQNQLRMDNKRQATITEWLKSWGQQNDS